MKNDEYADEAAERRCIECDRHMDRRGLLCRECRGIVSRDIDDMAEHVNKELEREMEKKVYLGDSVYAEFDGYGINLTTNNGYPDDPRNVIYMEPSVLQALNTFIDYLKKAAAKEA